MTQRRKRYGKQFKATAARVVPGGETRVVDLAVYLRVSVPRIWGGYGERRLLNLLIPNPLVEICPFRLNPQAGPPCGKIMRMLAVQRCVPAHG